ncbi:ATP-binding protein [Streptomyces sp. 2323.1]|uniref:ATP-binding protein n=1 Tax=Streptomyces sp. 2323.1 TaxID=1938841 RepID=UPI001331B6C7|nr:ATP-binding protein [Streptomyces sp. 2323.1]
MGENGSGVPLCVIDHHLGRAWNAHSASPRGRSAGPGRAPKSNRIELIVGELAGDSARHGRAETTVHLTLTDHDLRIDVLDTGRPIHPRPRPTRPRDECGRGLGIVSHLADWTDIRHLPHGRHARAGLRVALDVCTAA